MKSPLRKVKVYSPHTNYIELFLVWDVMVYLDISQRDSTQLFRFYLGLEWIIIVPTAFSIAWMMAAMSSLCSHLYLGIEASYHATRR